MNARIVLGMAVVFSVGVVRAATLHWDGGVVDIGANGDGASGGTGGTWDTTTLNWDQGAVLPHVNWTNANNDTAVFGTAGGKVTLGTGITVGGLSFEVGGFEVTNNTLTFGAAGSVTVATNVQAVQASALAGTQTITKDGPGKFILRGTSTRTGATVVASGSLRLENAAGFGAATAPITINSSGTLEIGTASTVANGTGVITLNSGGRIAAETTGAAGRIDKLINVEASGSAVVTFSSGGNANNILTINSGGNNRLAGGAAGAKIQITGSGEINIGESGQTRTNAVVADWYLQGGRFRIRGDDELGNDANQLFFEGGTFATDGTLSLDGGRVLNFGSGGTLDTSLGNLTLGAAGQLAGTGTVTKAGTNSLVLGGAIAGFSGDILVLGGSLVVNSPAALDAASDVSVAGDATLSGDGTIGGRVQIAQYGNLFAGASTGAIGTLTLTDSSTNALTLNGVALTVDLPASGTNCDLVAITGGLILNGVNTVFINAPNGAEPGTYTLMSYAAVSGSGTLVFANGTTNLGNASLAVNAGAVTVTIGAGGFSNSIWKGTDSAAWDTSTANWTKNGAALQLYADGDHVVFDNTATAGRFTVTGGVVSPASVTFNHTTGYSNSAAIGGANTPLVKMGSGVLVLSGTNTYGGGTIIHGGTVMLTAVGMDTNIGTGSVTINRTGTLTLNNGSGGVTLTRPLTLNGGTLKFFGSGANITASGPVVLAANSTVDMTGNNSGVQTITGAMSGPGGLTVINAPSTTILGILRLSGATNSYEGPTVVTIGGLTVKSSLYGNDTAKWTPANITVSNNATLMLNVGGTGEFSVAQASTLFSNLATSVSNNGLRAGSTMGVDTRNASGTHIFAGIIADSTGPGGGSLNFKHTGSASTTLELTGSNTYSGTTIVDNGSTLRISSLNSVVTDVSKGTVHSASSSLGAPTNAASGKIWLGSGGSPSNLGNTFQGGSLTYTGPGETTDRVLSLNGGGGENYRLDQSGTGLLKFISAFTMGDSRGNKTITLQGSTAGTGEIAGVIPNATSGNGTAITKAGSGTWTLSATNLYAGVTTISGGTLEVTKLALGTQPSSIGQSSNIASALVIANGARLRYIGPGDTTDRNFTMSGTVAGNNCIIDASGSGPLVFTATASPVNSTANIGYFLQLTGTNTDRNVFSAHMTNNGTGARNLTKNGEGLWVVAGSNEYTGVTTINAGTLLYNGTLSPGTNLVVVNGGTLGGTGTLGRTVNVSGGAVLKPGDPTGTLTIGSNLNIGAGATNLFALGSNSAAVAVGGNLTLNGVVVVTNAGGFAAGTNLLFSYAGTLTDNGIAVNNPLPGGLSGAIDTNTPGQVSLIVTGGPTPPTGYAAFSNLNALVQGPEGDDDGDGFANLYEYVTGSNPTNAGGIGVGAARPAGIFSLKFPRDTNSVDATLIVEGAYATTNNTEWIGFATNSNGSWGSSTNITEVGGPVVVDVTVPDIAPPATNRFLRLRISRP